MRYLIDTHIFIWHAREQHKLSPNVRAIIDDYANEICVSSETLKELVQLWNKKPLTNRIPLISADHKFEFYRNQGLELVVNR